jgi:Zn-dependent peptidase ImmA (M78 family)
MERACDRFAALLLMPEDMIRKCYDELVHNPGCRVSIMADRFGVSEWAMRRRLKELGLSVGRRRGTSS